MKAYYMIHRTEGGNVPNKMHPTLEDAKAEAKRLAQKHPGNTFVVLEAVAAYGILPVEPTEIPISKE